MSDVAWAALTGVLHLAIVAVIFGPLAWWTARRHGAVMLGDGAGRLLLVASAVYVASHALLSLPRVGPLADLEWNWQNKILLALVLAILVTAWRGLAWRDVGLTMPKPGWWRPVLTIVAGLLAFQLLAGPMDDMDVTAETVAFQALIPGLDEELLFRGVLLVLLDQALRARRPVGASEIGWAVPVVTLLFALVHGLHLETGPHVTFDLSPIIASGVAGVLLVWVRISSGSLLPAVLLHNAINSSVVLMVALDG